MTGRGKDAVLAKEEDDEDERGEMGEPALLPFSQLLELDGRKVDEGRLIRDRRFDDEPDIGLVLLGDVTDDESCLEK
jgi:hypothetical protein